MRIKQIIKDESGTSSWILAGIFVLVICMITGVGMEVLKVYLIQTNIKNCLRDSIFYSVEKNWDEIFPSNRQAYAGAYSFDTDTDGFIELIDRNDVMADFTERMGLLKEGDIYKKVDADGQEECQLSGLSVQIQNSTFASDAVSSRFDVEAEIMVTVYIRFFEAETELTFPVTVKTAFRPMF